ncbi:hypothetical protein T484DRAFT_3629926, partial [Baffinella frigidus]
PNPNPTPNTQHPTPNTQHPNPKPLNPNTQHPTPNTSHSNPKPNTQHPNPKPQTPTPKPNTQHLTPKPQSQHPTLKHLTPKPQTQNRTPNAVRTGSGMGPPQGKRALRLGHWVDCNRGKAQPWSPFPLIFPEAGPSRTRSSPTPHTQLPKQELPATMPAPSSRPHP